LDDSCRLLDCCKAAMQYRRVEDILASRELFVPKVCQILM